MFFFMNWCLAVLSGEPARCFLMSTGSSSLRRVADAVVEQPPPTLRNLVPQSVEERAKIVQDGKPATVKDLLVR